MTIVTIVGVTLLLFKHSPLETTLTDTFISALLLFIIFSALGMLVLLAGFGMLNFIVQVFKSSDSS